MNLIPVTRRKALLGAGATIAAAAISQIGPGAAFAAGPVRKRKNIETLSDTELAAYEHAIKIVKDRSAANPADPNGYDFWASLHDNFDDTIHSGCAHASEKFFPWHRRFLVDFEALLQKTDPSVTSNVMIPYWDWSVAPKKGVHFPSAFERTGSPLFDRRLNRNPPPWDQADLITKIKETDWGLFAGLPDNSNTFGNFPGSIETGPHNTLHQNISRDMASPDSAVKDPIFWSFHAGIDLVWSRWQRLHVSDAAPQKFGKPTAKIFFRDRSVEVGSTASATDLGYEYDFDFSIDGPPIPATVVAQAQTEGIHVTAKRVANFTSAAAAGGNVTLAPPASDFNAKTVLKLSDVKVMHDKNYRLNLYLHPKNVDVSSLSAEAGKGYFMRTISLWKSHHDTSMQIFIRPTAEQLAHLKEGWVVTVQGEAVPDEVDTSSPAAAKESVAPAALPATSQLFKTLELQER